MQNLKSQISNRESIFGHWTLIIVHCSLILLLVGCAGATAQANDDSLIASGFIEGEEVTVASETSGRIAEMLVDRGDTVQAGDVLIRLDDAALQSQRTEAEAGLSAAQANLDRVLAGARPAKCSCLRIFGP